MNTTSVRIGLALPLLAGTLTAASAAVTAVDLVQARDGSGVYGYKDTPKQPWCDYLVHDPDRPAPRRVHPRTAPAPAAPPSDAVVLFDGNNLSQWQPTEWKLVDGVVEAAGGHLTSKESFGNCQIHVEWMTPANFKGPWYNRGNNGVMLMASTKSKSSIRGMKRFTPTVRPRRSTARRRHG